MDLVGGTWVGNFACSVCKRKRLTAASFSATQIRKLRAGKIGENELRCKDCVESAAAADRKRYDLCLLCIFRALSFASDAIEPAVMQCGRGAQRRRNQGRAAAELRGMQAGSACVALLEHAGAQGGRRAQVPRMLREG